jgi:hypothetical protein
VGGVSSLETKFTDGTGLTFVGSTNASGLLLVDMTNGIMTGLFTGGGWFGEKVAW